MVGENSSTSALHKVHNMCPYMFNVIVPSITFQEYNGIYTANNFVAYLSEVHNA